MLLRHFIIVILALGSALIIEAQDYKFGKVETPAVAQEIHPNDDEAHAAYLYKKARVSFDFNSNGIRLVTEHHQRIKIYDEQGEDYGDFVEYLYKDGSTKVKISNIKGFTYNLENGKLVKSKLEKDAIFNEKASDNLTKYTWAMPDVRAGSVIEIKYTTRSPWIYTIPRFDFQADIPVDLAEYSVQIPDRMTYTPIPTGLFPLKTEQSERRGDSGMEKVYEFAANNVEALEDDDYVLDIDDYRSSLKYELYMTNIDIARYYSKSWDEITKDLMDSQYFGKELTRKTKDLNFLIEETASMEMDDKVKHIYTYVQTNFNWNKDYGIGKDEGVKKLLKTKSGNVGDINMLLVNLLKKAGVDARPFATKSRRSGLLNASYPSRSELNYLLAYVKKGDSFILLDATSKYIPIGQLPRRAININGILMFDERAEVVNLNNPNKSIYQAQCDYTIDLETPSLVGVGKSKRKNYAATQYRIDEDNSDEEEDTDEEEDSDEDDDDEDEDEDDEVIIENEVDYTSTIGFDNISSDLTFEFNEKIYNEINVIGDQIFIDAMLDFGPDENPFFEEERDMPIFYSSLPKVNNVMSITVPEGYAMESIPAPVKFVLEGRKMSFGYRVQEMNDKIIIYYNFSVSVDVFLPGEYPGIKQIYDAMIEKSKEKIVLTKV